MLYPRHNLLVATAMGSNGVVSSGLIDGGYLHTDMVLKGSKLKIELHHVYSVVGCIRIWRRRD